MRRPGAALLVLLLLIVADVVLVTGAIRSTHVDTSAYARAATNPADADGSAASPGAPVATPASTGQAPRARVVLAALTSTRAWRAVTPAAPCTSSDGTATIAHSENGGRSWTRATVPLKTVAGLSFSHGAMIATGLDTSCKPATYALRSGAAATKTGSSPAWGIDPADRSRLLTAGDPVADQPCTAAIVDIAVNSGSDAVVLCGNGSVQHTGDKGATWKQLADKAVSIATGPGGSVYVANRRACGISVHTATSSAGGCVSGTTQWSGPIDTTVVAGTLWITSASHAVTEPVSDLS